ncbi:MAG: universal stress protein [Hyphomicrobiaceae bacterium]
MTIKTILVHINDERRVQGLVDAAAHLATRHEAHLIGLYVMPPIPVYGSTAAGVGMVSSGLASFRTEAKRAQAVFEAACKGHPFVSEWRVVDPKAQGLAETVMDHGRAADLIIASQRDRSFDFTHVLDVPERLAIESGRPVLIVPHSGRFPQFGTRVTVAWNGRREAARATFDALPLLQAAANVRVIWVNPQAESRAAGDLPTAEIAASLARHGVKCDAATAVASDIKVGDTLLSGLTDDGSDLLVMGAYGHSRLREFVFGGATRHILDHMTVPVLMSH